MPADKAYDLRPYLNAMYDRSAQSFAIKPSSADRLLSAQAVLREKLIALLNLPVYGPSGDKPKAERVSFEVCDGYSLEKLSLEIAPSLTVPLYLLRPLNAEGPTPAALALNGHGRGVCDILGLDDPCGRPEGGNYQKQFAVELVKRGITVAAPEIIGFGESRIHEYMDKNGNGGDCYPISGMSLLWGGCTAGLRVYEAVRVIDYLETLPGVDIGRLGCMGISGGGTLTVNLTALDSRVKCALVSGYANFYKDSIYRVHHCIDNYIPGILQYAEMPDILSLIAPRPLLISSGSQDNIFPVWSTKRVESRLREIYACFGAEEKLQFDYFEGGHMISGEILFDAMRDMLQSL
jgi:dienelactone hydrolase